MKDDGWEGWEMTGLAMIEVPYAEVPDEAEAIRIARERLAVKESDVYRIDWDAEPDVFLEEADSRSPKHWLGVYSEYGRSSDASA